MALRLPDLATMLQYLRVLFVMSVLGGALGISAARAGPTAGVAPDLPDVEARFEEAPAPPAGWVTQRGVTALVHSEARDQETALRLARHAHEAVPRLARELGVPTGRTMHIYLAPTDEVFESMQPGAVPEWADGTAWPQRGLIYLHAPRDRLGGDEPLEQVLDHEIVHVLLGQAFAPRPVPRWLQEGVAQLKARQYSSHQTDALASGMLGGQLMSLDALTRGFPADPMRARLAYAQSADFVAYLQNMYGDRALQVLIREMSAGEPVGMALNAATGLTVRELEQEWRSRLQRSPMWLKPLVSDTALFTYASLFFVYGAFRVRRRNKETLARWEREEAIQDALSARLMGEWTDDGVPLGTPPEPETWRPERPEPWLH